MLDGGAEISAEIMLYTHGSNMKADTALIKTKLTLPCSQLLIPITVERWDFAQCMWSMVLRSHP